MAESALIDPRTGMPQGTYTEDEVMKSSANVYATATVANVPEQEVVNIAPAILPSIESNDSIKETHQHIGQIAFNSTKVGYLQSKRNIASDSFRETKDLTLLTEMDRLQKEIESLSSGMPEDVSKMWTWNWGVKTVAEVAGQMYDQTVSTYPDRLKKVIKTAPKMLTRPDKFLEGSVDALFGITNEYSVKQSRGEIYSNLLPLDIDEDIKDNVAVGFGSVAGSLDNIGEIASLVSGGGSVLAKSALSKALTWLGGQAAEGGTEGIQEVIGNLAQYRALSLQAERNGEEIPELTLAMVFENVPEAASAGLVGGAGIQAIGVGTAQGGKYSSAAVRAIRDRRTVEDNARKAKHKTEVEKVRKTELAEAVEKPVIATTDEPVGVEIQPEEIQSAQLDSVVHSITDGDLDDAMLAEDANEAVSAILKRVDEAKESRVDSFQTTLNDVLNDDKQADVVMSILNKRADALGISLEQYMENRGIELRDETDSVKPTEAGQVVKADVTVLGEVQSIIRAYQSADVGAMVHELGHIFRRDIKGADLATLEEWAGIPSGSKWTVAAEEKFARGWERYLAEGKAPSPELESTFQQITRWMMGIYKEIKGSDIDIQMSPEVTKIFDSLLVSSSNAKFEVDNNNTVATILESATKDEAVGRAARRAKNKTVKEQAEALGPISAEQSDALAIKTALREMRDMFDAGDKFGYTRAKNTLKAIIKRRKARGAIQKKHTKQRKKIMKLLKSYQPKGTNRKFRSRMSLPIQNTVTEIYEAFRKIKTSDLGKGHLGISGDLDIFELTGADALMFRYMEALSKADKAHLRQLSSIHKEIRELIETGKTNSPFMQNILAAQEVATNSIPEIIGGDTDIKSAKRLVAQDEQEAHKQRTRQKTWKQRVASNTLGHKFIFGWGGLLELLSPYSKSSTGASVLYKALDFFDARQQQSTEVRETLQNMQQTFKDIYQLSSDFKMNSVMNAHQDKVIDIGIGLLKSKSQVRQVWMYMQDPSLTKRLEKQGYTEEVRAKVEASMTEQDKAFASTLMSFWSSDGEYGRNSKIYEENFGVAMPRIENYVPIKAKSEESLAAAERKEQPMSQLQQDMYSRRSPETSGHLKGRAKNVVNSPIVISGDLGLFNGYAEEMAHFRAFTAPVRLANSVVKNKDFESAVKYEMGSSVYGVLKGNLADIAADGKAHANNIPVLDKFRSAFVSSTIGMSMSVMSKQLISTINYWQNMPASAYIKIITNPKQYARDIKTLINSDYVKNRTIDRDLKAIIASDEYKSFIRNPSIQNLFTMNVKIGDAAAISLGGAVYMRHLISTGMTKNQALREVTRKSERTQQSGTTEELSEFQRGGSAQKLMTMYSTGPIQAIRQELEAVRGVTSGRITKTQFAKTMFIYQVLVPTMYSLASSWISGEDEEEAAENAVLSMALGPFGMGYNVGKAVVAGTRHAVGMATYRDSGPFSDTVNGISNVANTVLEDGIEYLEQDDIASALQSVSILMGVGAPIQRVSRMVEGIFDEDLKAGVLGTNPNN